MFAEAIDVIIAIWEGDAPYDIDLPGNRYKVTTRKTMHLETGVGVMPSRIRSRGPRSSAPWSRRFRRA